MADAAILLEAACLATLVHITVIVMIIISVNAANVQGKATSMLHPLWRKIKALDSSIFYYNPFTGRVSKEAFPPPAPVLGGILADEVSFCARRL